jgi:hypothetical protein
MISWKYIYTSVAIHCLIQPIREREDEVKTPPPPPMSNMSDILILIPMCNMSDICKTFTKAFEQLQHNFNQYIIVFLK